MFINTAFIYNHCNLLGKMHFSSIGPLSVPPARPHYIQSDYCQIIVIVTSQYLLLNYGYSIPCRMCIICYELLYSLFISFMEDDISGSVELSKTVVLNLWSIPQN